MRTRKVVFSLGLVLALSPVLLRGQTPEVKDGVTIIHLDQHAGYFASKETLGGLKAGTYEFVVANKSGRSVGFQVQDLKTRKNIAQQGLAAGETKTVRVKITADGFRFRCPVNPTPWYELDTVAGE